MAAVAAYVVLDLLLLAAMADERLSVGVVPAGKSDLCGRRWSARGRGGRGGEEWEGGSELESHR